jgi:protein-S-isoprenylcysteine O-methyltransferase Ste14
MTLRDDLEKTGSWLFRHRSYLPVATVPIFLACLATFTYLGSERRINDAWQAFCLGVSVLGLAVRVITVGQAPSGTSGRNTAGQIADTLTTTGIYSVVRHPLYLGNYLIAVGFALWPHRWWLVLLITCIYALGYERIMLAEEAFLRQRFGSAFEKWAAETPAFIPRLHGWKPSPVPFSWRTVLQREYHAFFLIVFVFWAFDLIGNAVAEGHWQNDRAWLAALIVGFAIFSALRMIKKWTRLLEVEGR